MKRILLFTMMCLFGLFSLNAQETITIGEGSSQNFSLPIDVYSGNSFSQQSYSKDEIIAAGGEAGIITSLQYNVMQIMTTTPCRTLRVFIENIETEQEITFTSKGTRYHQLSNLDGLVYEGDHTFVKGWNEIVFQTPFTYTGNHLLITILDDSEGTDGNDIYFTTDSKVDYIDGAQVSWATAYSSKTDPTAIANANPSNSRNNIKLTFAESGEGGDEGDDELLTQGPVTIGSGDATNYRMPARTASNYTISQQIYQASEINAIGNISKIAFRLSLGTDTEERNWSIYLQNTDRSTIDANSWFTVDNDDLFFDGTVNLNAEWVEIEFDKDFEYTGENLMLCVYDKTGSNNWNDLPFYNYATTNTAISVYGNNAYDPANMTGGTVRAFNNQIQLTFAEEGEGGDEPEPTPTPTPSSVIASLTICCAANLLPNALAKLAELLAANAEPPVRIVAAIIADILRNWVPASCFAIHPLTASCASSPPKVSA